MRPPKPLIVGQIVDNFETSSIHDIVVLNHASLHFGWGILNIRLDGAQAEVQAASPEPGEQIDWTWSIVLPRRPILWEIYNAWDLRNPHVSRIRVLLSVVVDGACLINVSTAQAQFQVHPSKDAVYQHLLATNGRTDFLDSYRYYPMPCSLTPCPEEKDDRLRGQIEKLKAELTRLTESTVSGVDVIRRRILELEDDVQVVQANQGAMLKSAESLVERAMESMGVTWEQVYPQ